MRSKHVERGGPLDGSDRARPGRLWLDADWEHAPVRSLLYTPLRFLYLGLLSGGIIVGFVLFLIVWAVLGVLVVFVVLSPVIIGMVGGEEAAVSIAGDGAESWGALVGLVVGVAALFGFIVGLQGWWDRSGRDRWEAVRSRLRFRGLFMRKERSS